MRDIKREFFELINEKMSSYGMVSAEPLMTRIKGVVCTAAEIRALKYIDLHSGISSIKLAANTNKTRGAVSQMLKKLTDKNLVIVRNDPNHGKRKLLYVSELGKEFCNVHKQKDDERFEAIVEHLNNKYKPEEVELILDALCDLMKMPLPQPK